MFDAKKAALTFTFATTLLSTACGGGANVPSIQDVNSGIAPEPNRLVVPTPVTGSLNIETYMDVSPRETAMNLNADEVEVGQITIPEQVAKSQRVMTVKYDVSAMVDGQSKLGRFSFHSTRQY